MKYVKKVHELVKDEHDRVREQESDRRFRHHHPGQSFEVGDYCLVRCKPEPTVSARLQQKTYDGLYQVVEVFGEPEQAKAYVVSDLRGRRHDLGFQQPVHHDRLIPVEVGPLVKPAGESPTRIAIANRGRDRDATITAQTIDGKVYVRYDDDPSVEYCVDLTQLKYRWLET